MFDFAAPLRSRIRDNLERLVQESAPNSRHLKNAAVAIIVAPDEVGVASFLLTVRAARLGRHAGQFALPGGRIEPNETSDLAARRETQEEIGLTLPPGSLLGQLDGYETRSGYWITPHIYWCENVSELEPNAAEVAEVRSVSLTALNAPGSPEFVEGDTTGRPILRLRIGDQWIHAPTAALLYQFREIALHGRYVSIAHLDEPDFARR